MAKSASYYNVDDFNNYKRTQGRCIPPRANVLAAANHIQTLFDAKEFTYGFMGGLPMLCLGYKREMPDLHITYDARDFERLGVKLGSDRRVRLPTGMNPLLPFKILVWTGPSHRDHGCTIDATIELDLVPSGTYGSPTAGALAKSLVLLGLQTSSGKQMVFKSLNIQYLMATSLSYCKARDLLWDPRKDILYLCKYETGDLQRIRGKLNEREVKEMFLGTSFFARLDEDAQRLCYRTLLDTQPPPIMSVTPPASQAQTELQTRLEESDQNIESRLPRSRYRKAAGQESSSKSTAEHQSIDHARTQSAEHLLESQRLSYIEGVQYVRSAKPQTVLVTAATKNARNSMPNLTAAHRTPKKIYTDAQDTIRARLQEQTDNMPEAYRVHDRSSLKGPRPTHASSQLDYGAGFQPAYMDARLNTERAAHTIEAGHGMSSTSTKFGHTEPIRQAVHGIQSQRGSLHAVSPEREQVTCQQHIENIQASMRGKLHLVGPEGVYGAPQKPRETVQVQVEHLRHHSAPPPQKQRATLFELDASVPQSSTFVAELPADPIVPSSAEQQIARGDVAKQHQDTSRPSAVRTSSLPLGHGSLPSSLVVGRPELRAHHQSIDHRDTSDEPASTFSTHQTNAYRYSSYVLPSSVTPLVSSEAAIAPTYKAYRPFVTTNELNRNDSVSSVYSPGHRRDASDDSTASHDSIKLAREYQKLLNFDGGYGSN